MAKAKTAQTQPIKKPTAVKRASARIAKTTSKLNTEIVRDYDIAQIGGHSANWRGSNRDPNAELRAGRGLNGIRWRARDLDQNNPYARALVDRFVDGLVGTGLRPGIDTGNEALDALAYEIYELWCEVAVPNVKTTSAGLQRMFVRQRLRDGEFLCRIRPRYMEDMPGLPPVKLQPFEPDLLPMEKNETLENGHRIINGVELNALDEIVAYHLYQEHPNTDWIYRKSALIAETKSIPASSIIHSFRADRVGQLRGLPLITPCAVALWDFEGYLDSIRIAARGVANQVGYITTPNPADFDDGTNNPGMMSSGSDSENAGGASDEDTSDFVTDTSGTIVEDIAPGSILYVPDGCEFHVTDAKTPEGLADFISAMLHQIAASVGMSYHTLSGDMSDANFSEAKLGLIREAMNWKATRQCEIAPQICTQLWRVCMSYAVKADLFRLARPTQAQLLKLMRPTWSDPVMPSADRLDEARAAEIELRAGLRSRVDVIESNYGRDADEVTKEYAADKIARDAANLVCSWDLSQVSSSGIWQESMNSTSGSSTSTTQDSKKSK